MKSTHEEGFTKVNILNRRGFIKSAPIAAAAAAATPVLAFHVPPTETPEPRLPAWWEKLTGASAEADPEVYHPWRDTVLTRELAAKLDELHELLLLMGRPEGVDTITDFRLRWCDGVPQNVVAVGRHGAHGEGLNVFRPEFGWTDHSARIGGMV